MALSRFSRRLFIATAAIVLRAQTPERDLLGHLALPRFTGSGTDQIKAIATDRAGNIYVAGSTTSLDFPTKSAVQPQFGEWLIHRSINRGVSWQAISNPSEAPLAILPHPTDPAVILAASESGIFKTTDGGGRWRKVHEHEPVDGPYAEVTMAIDPAHPNAHGFPSAAMSTQGNFW